MAQITWRNVDIPRGGNDGIAGLGAAANMLSQGTSGLSDALGKYGQAQTDLADNAAAAAASRFQNSSDLAAALQSGALINGLQGAGVDPTRVTAKTLGDIQAGVTNRLTDEQNRQLMDVRGEKLAEDKYGFNRTQTQNTNTDSAAQAYGEYLNAKNNGNLDQANKIWTANAGLFGKLTPDQQSSLLTGGQTLNQGRLNAIGTGISNATNQFGLTQRQRDDAANQEAIKASADFANVSDPKSAYGLYAKKAADGSTSPQALQLLRGQLEQRFGPIFGGGTPGTAATGLIAGATAGGGVGASPGSLLGGPDYLAGAPGTENGGKYNVTFGYQKTDKPITTMTVDDLIKPGGLQDTIATTSGKPGVHTPIGAYQFTKDTLATLMKQRGMDPKTTVFTPDVQDQLGEDYFNQKKTGDLTKIWEGLNKIPGADKPGTFANVPWSQMKDIITKYEGTAKASNGQDLRDTQTNVTSDLADVANKLQGKVSQNRNDGMVRAVEAGQAPGAADATDSDAAAALMQKNPAFAKADLSTLTSKIRDTRKQFAGLNSTAAATLLANNLREGNGTVHEWLAKALHKTPLDSDKTWLSENLPSGMAFDDAALKELQKSGGVSGGAFDTANLNRHISDLTAQIPAALQSLQSAGAALNDARQRRALNSKVDTTPYEQAYNSALAHARLLQATANNNGSLYYPQAPGAPKN